MGRQLTWFGVLLIIICGDFWPRMAVADAILIGPSLGGYEIGQHLADSAMLDIAPCTSIKLWNGKEFVNLDGPYNGQLSAYTHPKSGCQVDRDGAGKRDIIREVSGERESVYDSFFHKICEKQNFCDAVCKAAFKLVKDQSGMTLKCQ
jgi:hypothetical protein